MHHCSEPPLSKTIVLARMGKEDVEGEGVGGEVYAILGRGSGRSDLRFSRWFWFRLAPRTAPVLRRTLPRSAALQRGLEAPVDLDADG